MTGTCTCCGAPTDHAEQHHNNQQKGDNHPDNLRAVDRRHHMEHHENERAVDQLTKQRYGPPGPSSFGPGSP